ncbi:hypothetical protein [Streptomyces sp. OE57]|uniref:hypothetical protein n=1 Tax=Streptomyces lacaronensis TaxID=3379885 RepID=UPI0039B78CF4
MRFDKDVLSDQVGDLIVSSHRVLHGQFEEAYAEAEGNGEAEEGQVVAGISRSPSGTIQLHAFRPMTNPTKPSHGPPLTVGVSVPQRPRRNYLVFPGLAAAMSCSNALPE